MRAEVGKRALSGLLLAALVLGAAVVAVNLHRRGHTTGDDWALYVRMAKGVFEGNLADVITDNRFLYDHSTAVTPPIYPWGWPVLLSPFVRLWDVTDNAVTDGGVEFFGRLKLVEVAVYCAWLVLFHGIVRRRAGRIVALALTAVFATAYVYLVHTDQLLTEFPHLLAVAVVVWWLDRVMTDSRLPAASTGNLVVLGLLAVVAYNVRREGIVLIAVIAAAQLVDLVGTHAAAVDAGAPPPFRRGRNRLAAIPWGRLVVPHATFVAGAAIAQFLLPSTLLPDNGNSRANIRTRLWNDSDVRNGNYPKQLVIQLGLNHPPTFGRVVMIAAVLGMVVACIRSPRRNVPLAVLVVATMLVIGTHFRMVARYYLQVTPYLLFLIAMLLLTVVGAIAGLVRRRPPSLTTRRVVAGLAAAPFVWLAVFHATDLPRRVDAAAAFNDTGSIQRGPATPANVEALAAVERYTRPDDVVVYYRARTATLFTGRQALQTTSLRNIIAVGDWFMQNRRDNYSQVVATEAELVAAGLELVWEDDNWRLWRIPDDLAQPGLASSTTMAAGADGSPDVHPTFPLPSGVGSSP